MKYEKPKAEAVSVKATTVVTYDGGDPSMCNYQCCYAYSCSFKWGS